MSSSLYNDNMKVHLAEVENALPQYMLKSDGILQDILFKAMNYACASGGKRLRPVLLLEFCRICDGDTARALPFACAIEMVHSYSLIHDDLPCMDNSPLRRGRPSVHVEFGESIALLAGDALLNRAYEVMLDPAIRCGIPAESVLRASFALADAAGASGMVGGQVVDLQCEQKNIDINTLEKLQKEKTAALIAAACEMGCNTAGAGDEKLNASREFGMQLGLCFQIVDDILDATSTEKQLGKPTGSDTKNGKATYVSLLGINEAKKLAAKRTLMAVESLSVFGSEANGLCDLAYSLLDRKN